LEATTGIASEKAFPFLSKLGGFNEWLWVFDDDRCCDAIAENAEAGIKAGRRCFTSQGAQTSI
jgi:hypothetical protein